MTRYPLYLAAAVAVAAGPSSSAFAQPQVPFGGPTQQPAFSPYLGLLSGFGNPGLNYLGIVQPQLQLQQQFNQIQMQNQQNMATLQSIANGTAYGIDTRLPLTGHGAVFNNTGHYFRSNPLYGGAGGGGGFRAGAFNTYGGSSQNFRPGSGAGGNLGVGGGGGGVGGGNRPNVGGGFGGFNPPLR